MKFVVEHRDEKSAWEAAALIPRYHWLRPVALHWCLLRCRQATRPWRAARDVWIFGHNQKMSQKICDLISCDVKVTFDATGLVPGSHYRHGYHKFTNFINHGQSLCEYYESGLTQEMLLFVMRGFAPALMAGTSRATLAFTFMPSGQD